ncbi:uncharacterized protein [Bemisia tabaci]|uniref:uncharacterized protein isoform X2 n=1 Tax=Bemisia tabaci TaxID=7038 RepID=UPI003B28866B
MTEDSMNMTVKLDGVGESLEFSAVWLRDNCRCKDCYNYATKQRSIDVTLLSPFCFACHYFFENEKLHLTWGDGHKSTFDIAFLRQYSQLEQWPQPFLWKGEEAKSLVTAISLGKFNQLEGQEEVANSILRNGLAIVSGVAGLPLLASRRRGRRNHLGRRFPRGHGTQVDGSAKLRDPRRDPRGGRVFGAGQAPPGDGSHPPTPRRHHRARTDPLQLLRSVAATPCKRERLLLGSSEARGYSARCRQRVEVQTRAGERGVHQQLACAPWPGLFLRHQEYGRRLCLHGRVFIQS